MSRQSLLPLFAVLVVSTACAGDLPISPTSASSISGARPAALAASQARPVGGRCETTLTPAAAKPGDPAGSQRLRIAYACQLTHLGHTTAIADQLVIFTGPTSAIASNTTTYTAANGDQLFATWTSTSVSIIGPAITFSGAETYAGGTGRFVGASGSTEISGTASFITFTGQFTAVGTLGY